MVMPYAVYNGRLVNPDTVLRERAGWRRTSFYQLMMQQDLGLYADCSQWEDRVNANELLIRAGEPGDSVSDLIAKEMKSYVRRLPNVHIVNTWIVRCRWYGVTSIGKAGWIKDAETGLLLPFDVYNIDPWLWEFGPNFEPYLIAQNSWQGVRTDAQGRPWEESVFFPRWGSNFTGYGQSDLLNLYLSCWTKQELWEMLLHSLRIGATPIPWIEVGSTYEGKDEKEFNDFETGIRNQYKFYVITRTPNAATSTSFPNMTAIANGGAGRSELEVMRYLDGLIQRGIHGTQQTQDKTGGSRALEDSRMGVAYDKTPPGLKLRDQSWNMGIFEHIGRVNYPNQPRELWPIMDSEAADDSQSLTGPQIVALQSVASDLRLGQISPEWATEELVLVGFRPKKAESMVASMVAMFSNAAMSPISLDGSKLQQCQEAVNRLVAGASTEEVTDIFLKSAGMPPAWAKALVASVKANLKTLSPVASVGASPSASNAMSREATEAEQMAETWALLEKVAA